MIISIADRQENNTCTQYKCCPRIQSIYEKYDSEDLYVIVYDAITFNELIDFVLQHYKTRIFRFKLSESLDGAISLLVNPYFDELCDYMQENCKNLHKKFLKFIKREIFDFFVTPKFMLISNWLSENGLKSELGDIGDQKLSKRSAEIIALIDNYV